MGYYKTKESVKEYIRLAEGVNGGDLIEKLKCFLTTKTRILELGSGPGTDWKILTSDFDVVGSDNSVEFLDHLKSKNPSGKFLELDAVTIETTEKYDGIYSNKVLHHLSDEELINSIERQSKILNPGGIVCHSFWKGEGSEIFKGLFVNYHMKDALINTFEKQFEVLLIESYEEFEPGDSLLLIGKKRDEK